MILIFLILFLMTFYLLKKTVFIEQLKKLALLIVVCFFVINIILFPECVFNAAKAGINTWFNIVFPALLPFFIGAELLIKLGVIRFIGILLEPVIRPIFNVPGEGSFVFAMSVTSGYPMGVKLTSELRKQNLFSKAEAQRLLSFCSTSGPLFMIGAVAVGMFYNLQLGIVIAISHYLGAIAAGLCFRFYKAKSSHLEVKIKDGRFIKRVYREFWLTIQKNDKPFGEILGSAVKNSVESLLVIGGFIILFSVIIQLLLKLGIINDMVRIISYTGLNYDENIIQALVSGIFEITIGCKLLSEIQTITFAQQAVFCSLLISWSGFSIHAQAASFISNTDLSVAIYVFSKFLHSFFSVIAAVILLPLSQPVFNRYHTPVFLNQGTGTMLSGWFDKIIFSSKLFFIIIIIFICFVSVSQLFILFSGSKVFHS